MIFLTCIAMAALREEAPSPLFPPGLNKGVWEIVLNRGEAAMLLFDFARSEAEASPGDLGSKSSNVIQGFQIPLGLTGKEKKN